MNREYCCQSPIGKVVAVVTAALTVVVGAFFLPYAASAAPLFDAGATTWSIRHDSLAGPTIRFAAEELQTTLAAISGATLPVVMEETAGPAIILGVLPEVTAPDEIAILSEPDVLRLGGGSERAVLHAVYAFLQDPLGVRWLWPGEDGAFIPRRTRWEVPPLASRYRPPIRYRGLHLCGDWRDVKDFRLWMARNFINIHRHGGHGDSRMFYNMQSSHNVRLPKELFALRPELFAQIRGQRYPSQMCFSQPEGEAIVAEQLLAKLPADLEILSLFPSDNMDYCQCPQCTAQGVSTAWFSFYNRLIAALHAQRPSLKFATIAYQGYRDVPAVAVSPCEFVEYASHARCHVHTLGDPTCERNRDTLAEMRQWQQTGAVMGHYAYEFDTFRASPFLPFFTIIEDAVQTSVSLGHVAVITEVSLSPRSGPPEQAYAVRNRLPIWLYARLLWNPYMRVTDLVWEWCETAYGAAAAPMRVYLLAMDRAWSALPVHCTILGQAATVAPQLITPELQKTAAEAFLAADRALDGAVNPAVEREKILFRQWLDMLGHDHEVLVPLLPATTEAPASAQGSSPLPLPGAAVRLAWSPEKLFVSDITAACEVVLSTGLGGETWHFAVDAAGTPSAWRISAVGVRDDRWQPEWSFSKGVMAIPFAALGAAPAGNEVWALRVLSGQQAFPEASAPPAGLRFCMSAKTDRTVLWWSGRPSRDDREVTHVRRQFQEAGWQFKLGVAANLATGSADVYWFRNPGYENKPPVEAWLEIRKRIEAGALAVFVSYARMPLEQYFDDPSFFVAVREIRGLPLAARQVKRLQPGAWLKTPHKLGNFGITPAYGLVPKQPEVWEALADMPVDGDQPDATVPFILARRYGQGTVVVMGDRVAVKPVQLVENFLQLHTP
ncbi:MAG TPA: DUF4838 domain-containing protein [Lentisphaeria bacterium]|nr:DUF4838 domain-containing protein [Lentisphaerota bacterium]OQC14912.1 MAG: hypothetical protein BWX73_01583 [Lentisphaerae bacterium ADurb.Bin082]HQC52901.1 DUF4838 domain-containing protein [Lentisphaeria bacterium]HQL87954.1 DUF4838 domain-containing protein [Lentisphaeria bacterium]